MPKTIYRITKRIFDISVSLICLILLSPFFLLIAILIKLDSEGHIIFKQKRVGKNGKIFTFYKFRTMIKDAEKETGPVWAKDNDKRLTKIGKYLKTTNLDELPQLYNVLKGDMSLIGPRPERPFFVEKFKLLIKDYNKRHQVMPGITGWAQVNGYVGNTSLKKRIEHDLHYIKHQSFLFDLKILFMTLRMIIKHITP